MSEGALQIRLRRWLLITGLVLVVLSTAGITHFVISASMAGFPDAVLAATWNWIFIDGHFLIGVIGLVLMGLARISGPPPCHSADDKDDSKGDQDANGSG